MNTLALFIVAVNPAAVAASVPRSALFRARAKVAFVTTVVTVVVLAGCSGPLLDWLDVSTPTFRVATGVVLGLAAGRWVVMGAGPIASGDRVPILTILLSPQLVAVAITAGADVGAVGAGSAAVVALVVSGAAVYWQGFWEMAVWSWATRLVGVAGVAVALALVVDGVKTV
jgi:small neutral amino acid transporter SnatA (MarC family)